MSEEASFETTSGAFAAAIVEDNPGATGSVSGGTWTITHASILKVTLDAYVRGGGSPSYPDRAIGGLPAWEDLGDSITSGVVDHHTHVELVITDTGTSKEYLGTTGPTRAESVEDPPTTYHDRLLTYGVV